MKRDRSDFSKIIKSFIVCFLFSFITLFSQNKNLALGKPVTSSSVDNPLFPNSNLTDGNFTTLSRTGTSQIPPNAEWFLVDLQADYYIQNITLGSIVPDNSRSRRFMIVTFPGNLPNLGSNPRTYLANSSALYNRFIYTPNTLADRYFGATSANPSVPGIAGQTLGPVFNNGIFNLNTGIHHARYILILNLQDSNLEFTEIQVTSGIIPVRNIVNGGFEQGTTATQLTYHLLPEATVPGWSTTDGVVGDPDNAARLISGQGGAIEFWRTGMNGVSAYEGNYFAELNSFSGSLLEQTPICILPNESFNWSFAHRGRAGVDVMRMVIDDTDLAEFSDNNSQTGTHIGTILGSASNDLTLNKDATTSTGWTRYFGTWKNNSGVSKQITFGFRAVSSSTGGAIEGNLLDDIRISGLTAIMTFDKMNPKGDETATTSNLPKILINGRLSVPRTVQVNITGGTAVRGTDYTTIPTTGPLSITIPAGNYDGTAATAVSLSSVLQINQDFIAEGDETIILRLEDPGTGDIRLADSNSCQGAVVTSTYSITDFVCYKNPVTTGITLNTNMGISAFNRAGSGNNVWPGIRKGAYLALESSTKGLVVTRTSKANITNPVIGMIIYEINDKCLSMYTSTGWKCYQSASCPD